MFDTVDSTKEENPPLRKYAHPITCESITYTNKPIKMSGNVPFDGQSIKSVACGEFHNVLLTDKGQVYSWGLATHG